MITNMLAAAALLVIPFADVYEAELHRALPEVELQAELSESIESDRYRIITEPGQYTVQAGSPYARDKGCARLLYELGFRFWTPQISHVPQLDHQPTVSMDSDVVWRANLFLAYGHDRRFDAGRKLLEDYDRWAKLTAVHSDYEPVGHAWKNIRLRLERAGKLPDGLFDGDTLNLSHPLAVSAVVDDRVVMLQEMQAVDPAHYMVSIEAADSDGTPSDEFYRWVNGVARGVRAEIPGAVVSTYAYAGHRNPPSFDLEPNVFVQVAIGFSTGNYPSYDALIDAWGQRCDRVGLREYVSVQAWDHGYPGQSRASEADYWIETLPRRHAAGCDVWRGETSANWMVNLYGTQVLVQTLMTGECDPDRVLDEVTEQVFDGDHDARRLYVYWSECPQLGPFLFRRSYDRLAEMSSCDLRDAVMIAHDRWKHGELPFSDQYHQLLGASAAVMPRDIVHSYALQRRIANGVLKPVRPDLWMFNVPPPDWYFNGEAPTLGNFIVEHHRLKEQTEVPDFSDELELVPHPQPRPLAAPPIEARHGMTVYAIGPVTLHVGSQVIELGEGQHRLRTEPRETVEYCRGEGSAAIEIHPERPPWLEPIRGGNAWLWHGGSDLLVDGQPRLTLLHSDGRTDAMASSRERGKQYTRIVGLSEQLTTVSGSNLRGLISTYSAPPLIQMRNDRLVLPVGIKK